MKKKLLIGLFGLMFLPLTACNTPGGMSRKTKALRLKGEVTTAIYHTEQEYLNFKDKVQDFSIDYSVKYHNLLGDGDNYACSPASLYMALSLVMECTNNDTRQEILDVLGISYQDALAYTKIYYAIMDQLEYAESIGGGKDKTKITTQSNFVNSIWLNTTVDEENLKEECLDSLANNYYCDTYYADFAHDNKNANKDFTKYVKDNTHGLIDRDFQIQTNLYAALVNTFYLKDRWLEENDLQFTKEDVNFENSNKSIKSLPFLQGKYHPTKTYEGENFTSSYISTQSGFVLHFIKPNKGYSVNDVFTNKTIKEVVNNLRYKHQNDKNLVRYYTRCIFPEFDIDSFAEISDVLTSMGITKIFNPYLADFSSLTSDPLVVSQVKQANAVKVNKTGIEAAAATVFMTKATSAGPDGYQEIYEDFIVDRDFGFVITRDNYVLFSGQVTTL